MYACVPKIKFNLLSLFFIFVMSLQQRQHLHHCIRYFKRILFLCELFRSYFYFFTVHFCLHKHNNSIELHQIWLFIKQEISLLRNGIVMSIVISINFSYFIFFFTSNFSYYSWNLLQNIIKLFNSKQLFQRAANPK